MEAIEEIILRHSERGMLKLKDYFKVLIQLHLLAMLQVTPEVQITLT